MWMWDCYLCKILRRYVPSSGLGSSTLCLFIRKRFRHSWHSRRAGADLSHASQRSRQPKCLQGWACRTVPWDNSLLCGCRQNMQQLWDKVTAGLAVWRIEVVNGIDEEEAEFSSRCCRFICSFSACWRCCWWSCFCLAPCLATNKSHSLARFSSGMSIE